MGCVGCAMVIIGLLIVFLSQKLRPNSKFHQDSLDGELLGSHVLDPRCIARRHSSATTWIVGPPQHSQRTESVTRRLSSPKPFAEFASIERRNPPSNQRRRQRRGILRRSHSTFATSQSISFTEEMLAPAASEQQLELLSRPWSPVGVATAALAIASVEHLHLRMHNSDEQDGDELMPTNNNWMPNDGYGDDHQAAIEAALSTVLTVSTLVGFRTQNHCCLHHAVQVSCDIIISTIHLTHLTGNFSANRLLSVSRANASNQKYKLRAKKWLRRLKREPAIQASSL